MTYKNLFIYFNIFILTITISFSNIYSNFSFAETTSQTQTSANAEASTETTTEAPSVIKNYCETDKQLDVKARAAILVDANTGLTLYEKNADEVLYPASITKILTTLLACEYGKFDESVTHSDNAINGIGYGSSTMGMVIGETIPFEEALYGIMMCSANETCMAVAEHISGSVDAFVGKMNEKAQALGCTNSHFANPHGFHDANHYTTARDMAKITVEAVKNPEFEKVWGTVVHTLPATNKVNEPRGLYNKAKILDDESKYYYPYILGAKTGFHDEALNTLVCCAEKDGIKLIAVVMKDNGAAFTYADSKLLFDYGFTQYEDKVVYNGGNYSGEIPAVQPYKGHEFLIGNIKTEVKGEITAFVPKFIDTSSVTAVPELDEKIELPVKTGDVVGKVKVSYNDYELGELDITTSENMDRADTMTMALKWMSIIAMTYGKTVLKYAGLFLLIIIILIIIIRIFRAICRSRKKKKNLRKRKKKSVSAQNKKARKQTQEIEKVTVRKKKKRPVNSEKEPVKQTTKKPVAKSSKRPVKQDNSKPVKKSVKQSDKPVKRKKPVKKINE